LVGLTPIQDVVFTLPEIKQKTQLMLTNRAMRSEVSKSHQTWYLPFDMLGMVSY